MAHLPHSFHVESGADKVGQRNTSSWRAAAVDGDNVTELMAFCTETPLWRAAWGDRTLLGTLADCLDFMGIYGSARDFHMREASRTGKTGGDIWCVHWSAGIDSQWEAQAS